MPTPIFALRLPQKTQDDIAELAKVYGAPNPRAFAREILEVVTSGDLTRLQAFTERLMSKMAGQLVLQLATIDTRATGNVAAAKKPKKRRRRAKRT